MRRAQRTRTVPRDWEMIGAVSTGVVLIGITILTGWIGFAMMR